MSTLYTYYIRVYRRDDGSTSYPGPPSLDEIVFICEGNNLRAADRLFLAFAKVTDTPTQYAYRYAGKYLSGGPVRPPKRDLV